jgi:hypothetical protein
MVVQEYYIKSDDPEIPQEVMSINSSIFDFIDNDHNQILFTNTIEIVVIIVLLFIFLAIIFNRVTLHRIGL